MENIDYNLSVARGGEYWKNVSYLTSLDADELKKKILAFDLNDNSDINIIYALSLINPDVIIKANLDHNFQQAKKSIQNSGQHQWMRGDSCEAKEIYGYVCTFNVNPNDLEKGHYWPDSLNGLAVKNNLITLCSEHNKMASNDIHLLLCLKNSEAIISWVFLLIKIILPRQKF